MKNIFFITTLLLGSQIAFGMYKENIKIIPNHPKIRTIRYGKSGNCKGYYATLNNGDVIRAELFVAGPAKGSYHCTRTMRLTHTMLTEGFDIDGGPAMLLGNKVYHELHALYKAQKD